MPSTNPVEVKRRYFTLEEANKMLPLVKAIAGDIVRQYETVQELRKRLAAVAVERRRPQNDVYTEELAHSQSQMEAEETKLATYIDELTKLGVEPKGLVDGLCDFPSLRDGRPIYLCWRLGEPQVMHWHELDAGVAGRQLIALAGSRRP
jgi:hypothetical protein